MARQIATVNVGKEDTRAFLSQQEESEWDLLEALTCRQHWVELSNQLLMSIDERKVLMGKNETSERMGDEREL